MYIVKRTGHPNWVMRDYYSILGFTSVPYICCVFIAYTCIIISKLEATKN